MWLWRYRPVQYFWMPLYEGALKYVTDTWSSPNHKAYMVVMVHFKNKGVPMAMLLDIVELTCSHSGFNLAAAFAKILEDFGISDKVKKLP